VARLCLACQTTAANRVEHCSTCGRNLREAEQAWLQGREAWLRYLEATGWYPGRRDEWLEHRLSIRRWDEHPVAAPPRRLAARYLGGHPALPRACRVVLRRADEAVVIGMPGWWLTRPSRVVVPLPSVRSVSIQRTTENTPDDAIVTAAIGGARTGPLGMAFGAAVGRRRRVVRTVHVRILIEREETELLFRPLDEQDASGPGMLVRIFKR
jgi:hypothetical protein